MRAQRRGLAAGGLADALCCPCPARGEEEGGGGAAEVYVLSAHVPEEEELPDSSQAEESWLPWDAVAWLLPLEALGSLGCRPKGGVCTQSLLAVLRRREEPRAEPPGGRRAIGFRELLEGMHAVACAAGCHSALLTLRSACRPAASVARALPALGELQRLPRALLVGICYTESSEWRLRGSWNDVQDLRAWLTSELQWPAGAVRVLSDHLPGASAQPTRANILQQLEWLLADGELDRPDADPGRSCRLLHFCGHGGEDELYPVDWETAGTISGRALAKWVAGGAGAGTTVTCLLDCCKSSTLFRSLRHKLQVPRPAQRESWHS